MKADKYKEIYRAIEEAGYGDDITWAKNIKECQNADSFWFEYMWVVIHSGMKNQIAHKIFDTILNSIKNGGKAQDVFNHSGKSKAIDDMLRNREKCFYEYKQTTNKLEYLESLSWIGKITKYHLAKNLGFDICKPDRHLVRIAKQYNKTPNQMCKDLSDETGDKVSVIDLVIWRGANLGYI